MFTKKLLLNYADNANENSVSFYLRQRRFTQFINSFTITDSTKILDVGGTENIWIGSGLEDNVTLLNINFVEKKNKRIKYIVGDGCKMDMFDNQQFDIVFSNSVIEHVGQFEKQKDFSEEVQRVGKKFWIQTPYKHFPIEPHFIFPLFQYFPFRIKKFIGLRWKYSHLFRNGEDILDELFRLRLLNKSEMRKLFPGSLIFYEKYFGLTKSLIAVKD